MADIQLKNFLAVLASTINENCIDEVKEPVNWDKVFDFANSQNVASLVLQKACEKDSFLNYEGYNREFVLCMTQVGEQVKNTEDFIELYKAFIKEDCYPIVMKGIVCREMYGEFADYRPSGDEDILVKKEDFNKADKILKSMGYICAEEEVSEEKLDSVQEIHYNSPVSSFYIELHINPMGKDSELRSRMNDCFLNCFDDYAELETHGIKIRTMNLTDHFLFVVLHAFRHFMAGGFGVRQVLDILVYAQKYWNDIDWNYIEEKLKDFDAWLFFNDLFYIGNEYMGFNLKTWTEPTNTDAMLNDLIGGGVFGIDSQAYSTAGQMTLAAVADRENTNSVKTLIKTIFPPKEHFYNEFPEVADKPWILPSIWVKRWGRFLKHSKANGGNLAKESMDISKKRIELLKEYKIL